MSIIHWDRFCDTCEILDFDPEEAFFTAEVEIDSEGLHQIFTAICDRCGCPVSEDDVRSCYMEQLEQERAAAEEFHTLGQYGF